MRVYSFALRVCTRVARKVRGFAADREGASIVVIALILPAIVGAMGLGAEVSYWHVQHRSEQNAADAAAIAAAFNGGPNFASEAKAVAAQYGFQDGVNNVTVTATQAATASGCAQNCYVVTVSNKVPLFFSQVVGFTGTSQTQGQSTTSISATAIATGGAARTYCLLALASSGAQGITSNGAPKADMQGCNLMSNTGATCNGHNLNATVGDAAGTNNGCGVTQNSNVTPLKDPYSNLASNLPSDTCGGTYPQEPSSKKGTPLPSSNLWSGNYTGTGVKVVCGDQQLIGDTTISNMILVIENGQLDINGYTLTGTNTTIVFSGSNNSAYQHIPSGGGTLDISAPTTGPWAGVAIYQDPSLTTNVNISAAGNSPTWNISGLVYLPHSSVTFSGAVNKSSSGASCFTLVVDNVTINGTGSIFANDTQCASTGLNQPQGGSRGALVN